MTPTKRLWLGHAQTGGKAEVPLEEGTKLLAIGGKANEAAALLAVAANECGASPTVFDVDGYASSRVSGHFDSYDYNSFLYDAYKLSDEESAWHAQLVAAAYTASLDLSSEEEAIVNAALQVLANQDNIASPPVVYDALGGVEGFRGFYVDKLKGRIGSLKLLNAVNDREIGLIMSGNVMVSFRGAPYPQASEFAAALLLAKVLTLSRPSGRKPGLLVVTDAHRIFRSSSRPQNANRLLGYLLGSGLSIAFVSDQPRSVSSLLLESCPLRLSSSDSWHADKERGQPSILPNSFVLVDERSNTFSAFLPRLIHPDAAETSVGRSPRFATPDLTRAILEEVDRFPSATRQSVASFLSAEYLQSDVEQELGRLHSRGYVIQEPKESGGGPDIFAYTLTESGRRLLQELRS